MGGQVEQGEGEGVADAAAPAEGDQLLLGLGGQGGHRIAAAQGLEAHGHLRGLALLEHKQVLGSGTGGEQIHRRTGQGVLGGERQGDAAGAPRDHEVLLAGDQAADGTRIVVVAALGHGVVGHHLPGRGPAGGVVAEQQLVVD